VIVAGALAGSGPKEKGRARPFDRVRDPVCPRSCPYGKYVKLLLFLQSMLENVPCFNAPEDEPAG
jgi:hypothetical protein